MGPVPAVDMKNSSSTFPCSATMFQTSSQISWDVRRNNKHKRIKNETYLIHILVPEESSQP